MKKILFTLFIFFAIFKIKACSCSQVSIVNAYSLFEFVGIIEFQTLNRIEDNNGIYESSYKLNELFKGKSDQKIFINSNELTSCSFLPELNKKYLVLGYLSENGIITVSYCSITQSPSFYKLQLLNELKKERIEENITLNIRQFFKSEIKHELFKKEINGFYLYKVELDNELNIVEIIPQNENAKSNFNDKILNELKSKIYYKKHEKELKKQMNNITSYIILNWSHNHNKKRKIYNMYL